MRTRLFPLILMRVNGPTKPMVVTTLNMVSGCPAFQLTLSSRMILNKQQSTGHKIAKTKTKDLTNCNLNYHKQKR